MDTEEPLKKRLCYFIASLFVVWHSGALIIAPLPESYLVNSIYTWYKPYLSLLNINNGWAFFAPNPHTGVRMFYILQNAAGDKEKINFTAQLQRETTSFQRYTMMQDYIWLKSSPYSQSAAEFLCRKHKDFAPISLTFEFHKTQIVQPEEYLQGLRATDQKNLVIELGEKFSCKF